MDSRLLAAKEMMDKPGVFVWAHGRLTAFRVLEKKDGNWKRVLFEVMTDSGSVSYLSSDMGLKDQDVVSVGDFVTCFGTESYYVKDGKIARSCTLKEIFLDKKAEKAATETVKITATQKLSSSQLKKLFGSSLQQNPSQNGTNSNIEFDDMEREENQVEEIVEMEGNERNVVGTPHKEKSEKSRKRKKQKREVSHDSG